MPLKKGFAEASARRIVLVNTTGEKVEADFKVPGVKAKRIQRTFAPYETAVENVVKERKSEQ